MPVEASTTRSGWLMRMPSTVASPAFALADFAARRRRPSSSAGAAFSRRRLPLRFPSRLARRTSAPLLRRRGGDGDRPVGEDALRLGVDDAVLRARPRRVVLLLDQQPRLLPLAGAAVHPHQRPAAVQLLAVEAELELAGAVAGARSPTGCQVPLSQTITRARAVLAFRDRALEAAVVDRMVLDVHRHALVGGIEARAFRHRPALQRAVELEAKVVVKAARGVLLDHERQRAFRRLAALRLARDREIALAEVGLQRGTFFVFFLKLRGRGVCSRLRSALFFET